MIQRNSTRQGAVSPQDRPRRRSWRRRIARALAVVLALLALAHLAGLLGWVAIHAILGDSRWWSFLLNTFALYLFVPLVALIPLALVVRQAVLRACTLVSTILFLVFYGGLFVPPALRPTPAANAPRLSVMTFNVHVSNQNPAGVVDAIRTANADVVGLQEVNPVMAAALRQDLSGRYPYQILEAPGAVSTLAVLSRYPLQPTGITLSGDWNDAPLVVRLQLASATVTILNAHPVSTLLSRGEIRQETQDRAETAHVVAGFVAAQRTPVIVLTDFNAGDQSTPYAIVGTVLADAWRDKGFGFGHTFPGDNSFNGTRPRVRDWYIPQWLVRIDYVFHSRQWRTVEAHLGPWDGTSDHRPVCATLALSPGS